MSDVLWYSYFSPQGIYLKILAVIILNSSCHQINLSPFPPAPFLPQMQEAAAAILHFHVRLLTNTVPTETPSGSGISSLHLSGDFFNSYLWFEHISLSIPGSLQGQVGGGLEQPGPVEGVPAHDRVE